MRLERTVRRREKMARAVLGTVLFLKILGVGGIPEAAGLESVPGQTEKEREKVIEEQVLIEEGKSTSQTEPSSEQQAAREEMKRLEKELLQFPKKKRLHFGSDFDMTYDTNPSGFPIHHEKGDTTFNLSPSVQFDLGGHKTDLVYEYRWHPTYNVKRSVTPGSDTVNQEMTLRFGRKILPRALFSLNDRLSRQSARVQGIDDGKKIEWDQSYRPALNYELSKKFSINMEGSYTRTDFPHENFHRDKTHQYTFNPALFFQMTPKTRFSGGYSLTVARAAAKSSDNKNHEFRISYFGRMTGKSSVSADVGLSRQSPDSAAAATSDKIVWSAGYIWQATPKTSLRLLYSSSVTRSMTDALAGGGPYTFTKTRTVSISDSLSLSARFRLNRKINTEFSFDGSHAYTKTRVSEGLPSDSKSQQWTFPFQVAIEYNLARWIRLRLTYTYRHQIGDERKIDEYRKHTWFFGSNMSF